MSDFVNQFSLRLQMFFVAGAGAIGAAAGAASVALFDPAGQAGHSVVTWSVMGIGVLLPFAVAFWLGRHAARRAEHIVEGLKSLASGDLTYRCKLSGRDEFAWMAWEFTSARKSFAQVVDKVLSNCGALATAADQLSTVTSQSQAGINRQNRRRSSSPMRLPN